MTRTLTTAKGRSVETPYSDEQALSIIRGADNPSAFALDLAKKAERYGLSADQTTWTHIIACEMTGVSKKVETAIDGFGAVLEYLKGARDSGLKFPKVRLQTADGARVVLSITGERSRRPGTVNITDGRPFGENTWYGWINDLGQLKPSASMTPAVREVLEAFAANPAETAKAQGQLTGNCCFCGKGLETKESVGAGYGPVCASNWGLPWGAETAAQYEAKKAAAVAPVATSEAPEGEDFDVEAFILKSELEANGIPV